MKIAIFTDTYLPQMNGVVAYLCDSIKILGKSNELVLFAPGNGPGRLEQISEKLKIYWIPASPFPFYEGYRMASVNYKRVSDILKRERPDIVHAHAPVILGLQGIISAKRKGIPVVITYHTHFPDYLPHLLNGKLPGILNKLGRYTVKKLIKHAFKRADIVTAPTRELVKELRSYGLQNVVYIPNGVDFKKFKRDRRKEVEFRNEHGIQKKKTVLYVGRISFEKKLDVLLDAFRMIEKRDRQLLIVGSGPYLHKVKDLAKGLGIKNVIFTGFVRDTVAAYQCADIFASASDSETFGLTFVEAMHMGLPVIGVRRLGAKEIIKNGNCGILVEPGNGRELADAIDKLLENRKLHGRMSEQARRRSTIYSMEKSINKMLKIYEKLVSRRS